MSVLLKNQFSSVSLLKSATRTNVRRLAVAALVSIIVLVGTFSLSEYLGIGLEDLSKARPLTHRETADLLPRTTHSYSLASVTADFNRVTVDFQNGVHIGADTYAAAVVELEIPSESITHVEFFLSPIGKVFGSKNPYMGAESINYSVYLDSSLLITGEVDDLDEKFISYELSEVKARERVRLEIMIWSRKALPSSVETGSGAISLEYVGFSDLD